jgi:hypothetical protein
MLKWGNPLGVAGVFFSEFDGDPLAGGSFVLADHL